MLKNIELRTYREDLDEQLHAPVEDGEPELFGIRCHMGGRLEVSYRAGGVVRVACAECGDVIANLVIAHRPEVTAFDVERYKEHAAI